MMSQPNPVQSISDKIPAKITSKAPIRKKSSGMWLLVSLICIGAAGAATFFLIPSVKDAVLQAVENVAGVHSTAPVVSSNPVSQAQTPPKASLQAQQSVKSQATLSTASTATVEQSTDHIAIAKDIAKTYADMTPSKAAAALTQLTDLEIVYAMTEMSTKQRALIWSKMDPGRVAALSVQMKSRSLVKDHELALIQRKINKQNSDLSNQSVKELIHTLSKMSSASAAKLIHQLFQKDSTKTIHVLQKMDVNNRASILTVMSGDPVMMNTAEQISQSFLK